MSTLADMRAMIAAEMNRDDLATDLADVLQKHIERACEYYSDTKFWFNSILTTATTTTNVATVAIPATVRIVERVTLPDYDMELRERTASLLPETMSPSIPSHYAYYNDNLRFYPTPDGAYTLNIYGVAQIDAPTLDADTSVWTNEAEALISAHVRMTLYRGVFFDGEATTMTMGEVGEQLARLKRETARRLSAPLMTARSANRYNILTDT